MSEKELDDITWQEFEEYIRDILSHHDFEVKFRKVFKAGDRGYQIDVVGYKKDLCICIDAKKYGRGRHRSSSLKNEAKKHYDRCVAHEDTFKIRSIPIIVSWLDDDLMIENGCIFVPSFMLNDFLLNIYGYLDTMGYE
jgi:hypothetical protein